jgi:hypothetical protein
MLDEINTRVLLGHLLLHRMKVCQVIVGGLDLLPSLILVSIVLKDLALSNLTIFWKVVQSIRAVSNEIAKFLMLL